MIAAAALAVAAAQLTIWCTQIQQITASDPPVVKSYQAAENALCHGQFADARDAFASVVPYWSTNQSNGRWWIDTARGYFYSLMATGQDAKARNFLTSLETYQKWHAHKGDHLFWQASPRAAFSAYAAEGVTVDGTPDGDRDNNIDNAARESDMSAAITILMKPAGATGPSTAQSLQLLMLGEAYETQQRWKDAFTTWARAADSGHAVPEYDSLDDWNLSALEMIYYYRRHIPPGQRAHS